ncbi:MAG: hypothetical protein ACYSWO_28200 [Planctomycetota bacterium]|jgi:hypothetical protein
MKKQATQIIPGDSVRVADIYLVEGYPQGHPDHKLYRKVLSVQPRALTVDITLTGDHWGYVAKTAAVRVHARSNRAANIINDRN